MNNHRNSINEDFICKHCRCLVSTNNFFSGVQNRNHCPYCLWSRHLDLYQPGDRLCACKAGMKPVGLTLKLSRKKYGGPDQGELMLIHQCTDCGALSINRIAADDDNQTILEIFSASSLLDLNLRSEINRQGIRLLGKTDKNLVYQKLFGSGENPVPVRATEIAFPI